MTARTCPFEPSEGYATVQGRREWLKDRGITGSRVLKISQSLEADPDVSKPLYHWQLYSLLGSQAIYDIVERFYGRVFQDEDAPWFRNVFARIASRDYHVHVQACYWIDVMGGGERYHGGSYRIDFHHTHNAHEIMNAAGAKRWMFHMRAALNEQSFDDPRIKPCIVDFLKVKMKRYARVHKWKFDKGDFDFNDTEEATDNVTATAETVSTEATESVTSEEDFEENKEEDGKEQL